MPKGRIEEEIKRILQDYEEMHSPFQEQEYVDFMNALAAEATKRADIYAEVLKEEQSA